MALDYIDCSSNIWSSYNTLITSFAPGDTPSNASFVESFVDSYNTYAVQGQLSGQGGVSGSENPQILFSFMGSLTGNTSPELLGSMFCEYWSTCFLIPGSGVISVTNNALSLQSEFISSIYSSITNQDTQPYFQQFIGNLQGVVTQIEWTVVRPNSTTIEIIS